MGDGDGATIGGNHLIHAARRNVDVTAILVNNFNYGMTGGQYSGTTPEESYTTTSQYGHIEQGFDLCKLAEAAGAPYVARASTYGVIQMKKLIEDGIRKKRLLTYRSNIPMSQPTFGRNNKMRQPAQMLKWINENLSHRQTSRKMTAEQLEEKISYRQIC